MKKKTDSTPHVSIVILSYNVRKLLVDCLQSLYKDPDSEHWQIIVVDNASQDDSVAVVKKQFKEVMMIESEKNLGFSAGNNLAVSKIKAPYTLFLNPDTVVKQGTISTIERYLKVHPKVGAATCKVVLGNGKLDDGCHRGFPTPWNAICHFGKLEMLFPKAKLFSGYNMAYKGYDSIHEIDSLTGAFMMLPTDLGRKLKWWDEDYFWNGEDLDFCFRIKQAGFPVMYVPNVEITHYKGSSGGYKSSSHGAKTVDPKIKQNAAKASTQAMRIFYRKHYAESYPEFVTALVLAGIGLLEKYRLSKVQS